MDPSAANLGNGAYYNFNQAQRHGHPSSSSRRWLPGLLGASPQQLLTSRPQYYYYNYHNPMQSPDQYRPRRLQEAAPLQLLTSWPLWQPQGGYIVNQSSSGVSIIPTDGNISGGDWAPLEITMPGRGDHYSGSVAPMPNVIGSQYQYQPHPDSATVFPAFGNSNNVIPHAPVYPTGAGFYAQHPTAFSTHAPVYPLGPGAAIYPQQPGSATVFPGPGYNYNSSVIPPHAPVYAQQPGYNSNPLHASVYQPGAPLYPQPGAAIDFSALDGNANNDPYTCAGLIAPPANANQGVVFVPNHLQANPAAFATNPETSGKLISMLDQDDHDCRVRVTKSVLEDVRMVMSSHTGHAVLLALLGAIERANMLSVLDAIVSAAVSPRYNGAPLMEVANVSSGELALKELVRLAALHLQPVPVVLRKLFGCLIDGWKMEQSNGAELLHHFFSTLPVEHCSIFIEELAIARFGEMVRTRIGYMSIIVCLDNAGYTEQGTTLQNTIVTQTVQIANERYGCCLLHAVLQRGRNDQLEERIRERVVQNLVELSMGRYGSVVVQECFVPSDLEPSVPLLERGLDAFFRLPDEQLGELAQNHWAGCVLRRLLQTSVNHKLAEKEATELAKRILEVVAAGDETDAPEGDPREQAIAILQ